MSLKNKISEIKSKLKKNKDQDLNEMEALENEPVPDELEDDFSGDISIEEESSKVTGIKNKKVLATIVGVGALVIGSTVYSHFAPEAPKEAEKPMLSNAAEAAPNPNNMPKKYSEIQKYQNDNKLDENENTEVPSGNDIKEPTDNNGYDNGNYSNASANYPQNNANYYPANSKENNQNYAEENQKRQQEDERKRAIRRSALAFKITTDITQGKGINYVSQSNTQLSKKTTVNNGKYVVHAGSIISATLLTGITSDMPNSDVVAQIRANVFDSVTGRHLLIPAGSRLIGKVGEAGGLGNKRLNVVFNRIIFPNGNSVDLPNFQSIDGTGYPGLTDKYSEHRGNAFKYGIMSALFGSAAQSSTGNTQGSDKRSPGQEAVSGAVAEFIKTGQELIKRELQKPATIQVRPGYQFNIFINEDLHLGKY